MLSMIFFIGAFVYTIFLLVMFFLSDLNLSELGKASTFECGVESLSFTRIPFSSQFFFIGIIFVLFDLEIMFLVHFCISLSKWTLLFSWWIFFIFFTFLLLTLFLEWNWDSLNWIF